MALFKGTRIVDLPPVTADQNTLLLAQHEQSTGSVSVYSIAQYLNATGIGLYIPSTDNTVDLGSPSNRFRTLYVNSVQADTINTSNLEFDIANFTTSWNNPSTEFVALNLSVTDTQSLISSKFIEMFVNGVTKFSVRKDGQVTIGGDANLIRDAANTLAMRNGVNAQGFRVYNTFTDINNFERGKFAWTSNALFIGTEAAGTGTLRDLGLNGNFITIQTNNLARWYWNPSGHYVAQTDNTYDIGATGGTRPRSGYFGTSVQTPSVVSGSGAGITLGNDVTLAGGVIIPATDNSIDLGSSTLTRRWRTIYAATSIVVGTSTVVLSSAGGVGMSSAVPLAWSSGADASSGRDLTFFRGGAGILEQRNGAANQAIRIYSTYTDGSNYSRLTINNSATESTIYTEQAGTGSARNLWLGTTGSAFIRFQTNGTSRWTIDANGHLTAVTDNSFDIGDSAGTRPRIVYAASGISVNSKAVLQLAGTPNTGSGMLQLNRAADGFGWSMFPTTANVLTFTTGSGGTQTTKATWADNGDLTLFNPLKFSADNTHDIGASGALRPRAGYFGTSIYSPQYDLSATAGTYGLAVSGSQVVLRAGSTGSILFVTNATSVWAFNSTGHMAPVANNTLDIGTVTTNTVRNIYVGTAVTTPSVTTGADLAISAGQNINVMSGGVTVKWVFDTAGRFVPNANNTYDIGTGAATVKTGYFGTSVSSPLYTGAGAVTIGTTGATNMLFQTNNTTRWFFDSSGHLQPNVNNTYDIGGANKVRTVSATGFSGTTLSLAGAAAAINLNRQDTSLAAWVFQAPAGRLIVNSQNSGWVGDRLYVLESGGIELPVGGIELQQATSFLRTYNVGAGTANYERASANWSSNVYNIIVESSGTGSTTRDFAIGTGTSSTGRLIVRTGGADRWLFTTTNITPVADATNDIGTVSLRVRDAYLSRNIYATYFMVGAGAAGRAGMSDDGGGTSNTIAFDNVTNRVTLRVYGTRTDASNYERLSVQYDSTTTSVRILTEQGGTGTARPLTIGTAGSAAVNVQTNGVTRWQWDTSGNFIALADGAYDIGQPQVGATPNTGRVRNIYLTGDVYTSSINTQPVVPVTATKVTTENVYMSAQDIRPIHRNVAGPSVTAVVPYDTTKDSDGGAWVNKVDASYMYEPLANNWLRWQPSEMHARLANAVTGPELISDPNLENPAAWTGSWYTFRDGKAIRSFNANAGGLTIPVTLQPFTVYRCELKLSTTVPPWVNLSGNNYGQMQVATSFLANPDNFVSAFQTGLPGDTLVFYVIPTSVSDKFGFRTNTNNYTDIESVSLRQVMVVPTLNTGDYYGSVVDGKFYKLWKNTIPYSNEFESWTLNAATVLTNQIANPVDGLINVRKIVENSANVPHTAQGAQGGIASMYGPVTGSIYLKAAERTRAFISIVKQPPNVDCTIAVNLTTGAIEGNSSPNCIFMGATCTAVPGATGWWRITVTGVDFASTAGSWGMTVWVADGAESFSYGSRNGHQGDGTSGIYAYGAQLEYGTSATLLEHKVGNVLGQTEIFRGNKAKPPRFALGVLESTGRCVIYDALEPGSPMWMVFKTSSSINLTSHLGAGASVALQALAFREGQMYVGTGTQGLRIVDFTRDRAEFRQSVSSAAMHGNIAQRNVEYSVPPIPISSSNIINNNVLSLAATALPESPFDAQTGLQSPLVAVATAGGVSVILPDGTVRTSASTSSCTHVSITPYMLAWYDSNFTSTAIVLQPGKVGAAFTTGSAPANFGTPNNNTNRQIIFGRSGIARSTGSAAPPLFARMRTNESTLTSSMVNLMTNTWNSGWLIGDTTRCTLTDAAPAYVLGTELVTNGDFAAGGTGWTASTWTFSSGTALNSSNGYLSQVSPQLLSIGDTVRITWTINAIASGLVYPTIAGVLYVPGGRNTIGVHTVDVPVSYIVDQTVGLTTGNSPSGFVIDNVSIKKLTLGATSYGGAELLTDPDFNSGAGWRLAVNGTSTTASVAAGVVSLPRNDGSNLGYAAQAFPTIPGQAYTVTVNNSGAVNAQVRVGNSYLGTEIMAPVVINAASTVSATFLATLTIHYVCLVSNVDSTTATVTSCSIKEAMGERSSKQKHGVVAGTLTRTPVATGSNLTFWSGFSASNYVQEAFSSDLDPGTTGSNSNPLFASFWGLLPTTITTTGFPVAATPTLSSWTNNTFGSFSTSGGSQVTATKSGAGGTDTANLGPTFSITNAKAYRITVVIASNTYPSALNIQLGQTTNARSNTFTLTGTGAVSGIVTATATQSGISLLLSSTTLGTVNITSATVEELDPSWAFDRSAASGPYYRFGVKADGALAAEVYDGTTTRTVLTTLALNNNIPFLAMMDYAASGTLTVRVNGAVQAQTSGTPLLTLANGSAVFVAGNNRTLTGAWPGSLTMLRVGRGVAPTEDQILCQYNEEKVMFRDNTAVTLPALETVADISYDDVLDQFTTASTTYESVVNGFVRSSFVQSAPGTLTRTASKNGYRFRARASTLLGVDMFVPSQNMKDEIVRRSEEASRRSLTLEPYDWTGGFTCTTSIGSSLLDNLGVFSQPAGASFVGAQVTANVNFTGTRTIVYHNRTAINFSVDAASTGGGAVTVSFLDFILPLGMEARDVYVAGAMKREGAGFDYTRIFDGFRERVRFASAPGSSAWVRINGRKFTI